jgi:hydrogenase expression/formation protein HypC
MCLAIPVQVKSIHGRQAEVEVGGVSRKVSIWLTPDVKVGDWVLLHTGYAISIIDEAEAKETLRLLEEMVAESE